MVLRTSQQVVIVRVGSSGQVGGSTLFTGHDKRRTALDSDINHITPDSSPDTLNWILCLYRKLHLSLCLSLLTCSIIARAEYHTGAGSEVLCGRRTRQCQMSSAFFAVCCNLVGRCMFTLTRQNGYASQGVISQGESSYLPCGYRFGTFANCKGYFGLVSLGVPRTNDVSSQD